MVNIFIRIITALLIVCVGNILVALVIGGQTQTHTLSIQLWVLGNEGPEVRLINLDRGLSLFMDAPMPTPFQNFVGEFGSQGLSPTGDRMISGYGAALFVTEFTSESGDTLRQRASGTGSSYALFPGQITSASALSWSSDGRYLALISEGSVYVVDFDTDELRTITQNEDTNLYLAWSPNGHCLAYIGYNPQNISLLSVVCLESEPSYALTITLPSDGHLLEWSPDGQWLSFLAHQDGPEDLYTFHLETQALYHVVDNESYAGIPERHWSPDSTQLLLEIVVGRSHAIYLVNPAGDQVHLLTNQGIGPNWSPRGTYVTYHAREVTTQAQISYTFYVIEVLEELVEPISVEGHCTMLTWSQDETVLAFVRTSSQGDRQLAVLYPGNRDIEYLTEHNEEVMDVYFPQ